MSDGDQKKWSDGKKWFMGIISAIIVFSLTVIINHILTTEKDKYGISFAQSTLNPEIISGGVSFNVEYHLLSALDQDTHLFVQVFKESELKNILLEKEVFNPNSTSKSLILIKDEFDIAYVRLSIKGSDGEIISKSEAIKLIHPRS